MTSVSSLKTVAPHSLRFADGEPMELRTEEAVRLELDQRAKHPSEGHGDNTPANRKMDVFCPSSEPEVAVPDHPLLCICTTPTTDHLFIGLL